MYIDPEKKKDAVKRSHPYKKDDSEGKGCSS